jgi:hypothetical protein
LRSLVPELRVLDPLDAARLVIAIAVHWTVRGFGPSWRYANQTAGLHWKGSKELADCMWMLKRAGLVTFTREANSLDTTPAGRRWALETLRVQKTGSSEEAREVAAPAPKGVSTVAGDGSRASSRPPVCSGCGSPVPSPANGDVPRA